MNVTYLGTVYALHSEFDIDWFFAVIVNQTEAA